MQNKDLTEVLSKISEKYKNIILENSRTFILVEFIFKEKNFIALVPAIRKNKQDLISGINKSRFSGYVQLENKILVHEAIAKESRLSYRKFVLPDVMFFCKGE